MQVVKGKYDNLQPHHPPTPIRVTENLAAAEMGQNLHHPSSRNATGGNRTTQTMNQIHFSDTSNFNHAVAHNDDAQTTTSTIAQSNPASTLNTDQERVLSVLRSIEHHNAKVKKAWDTLLLHSIHTALKAPLPEQSHDEWLKGHEEILHWHNSYQVVEYLLALYGAEPQRRQWWFRLFGGWWTDCDGMHRYRKELKKVFKKATRQNLDDMMDEAEATRFAELPDPIRVYRGCQKGDKTGLSFTLSREVAMKFPFYNRYRAETPVVITADVPKKYAVLKMDRNEDEIIACGPVSIVSTELIVQEEISSSVESAVNGCGLGVEGSLVA